MIIRINKLPPPWPEWAHATTIWPFIFIERSHDTPCLIEHEKFHLKDQFRWLIVPWYLTYAFCAVILRQGGGRRNWMERGGYRAQEQCNGN